MKGLAIKAKPFFILNHKERFFTVGSRRIPPQNNTQKDFIHHAGKYKESGDDNLFQRPYD
jgi:hypothetical protein